MQSDRPKYGPCSKKQAMFLNSAADIVVYGGAAGSGKSYLGYLTMLKHIHDPRFRGMIIRRTTPMLTKPGGVIDTTEAIYRDVEPKVRFGRKAMKYEWPSGAIIQCGHCEHEKNKFDYQG